MKKLALALSVILCLAAFTACAPKTTTSTPNSTSASAPAAQPKVEGTLEEIMGKLYEGIPEDKAITTMDTPVTEEMSVSFTGVEMSEYKEALASDAMVNVTAHSVVLVRANSADEAAALATKIEEKADPRKWICAEAESKTVTQIGDVVLLVMTSEEIASTIVDNFKALAK